MTPMAASHAVRRRGSATVELAVVLPVLLVIFAVAADFARAYYCAQIVTDCARNGAVYASQPDLADRCSYETVEEASLAGARDLSPIPRVVTAEFTDAAGNRYAAVTVTHTFELLTGLLKTRTLDISHTACARIHPQGTEE